MSLLKEFLLTHVNALRHKFDLKEKMYYAQFLNATGENKIICNRTKKNNILIKTAQNI